MKERVIPGPALQLDLAVIGAGAAGTYVADALGRARPGWSIALFERQDRIGGRVRTLHVPGLEHPVELGGMRFLTSHRRVQEVVERFGIATHPFGGARGPDRFVLRGILSDGAGDPAAGRAYDLPNAERGRSAADLIVGAFERIVPGATQLDDEGWIGTRATHRHQGRPLIDWSIGDALASVLSSEAHRFVTDAFGYDSGLRGFNAGDAIPYLLGSGDPSAMALTPDDGMDCVPRALAGAFESNGGSLQLEYEVTSVTGQDGSYRLTFANGVAANAQRVVLAMPTPALNLLAAESPPLQTPAVRTVLESVDAWPGAKLYLWFDRPWWRDDFAGTRITTDLPPRKLFYFDDGPRRPATLLASYTDGRDIEPWAALTDGSPAGSAGSPASPAMIGAIRGYLRTLNPTAEMPEPIGSAFMHWGADPHEAGWHYWRAGATSDAMIAAAPQPEPSQALYLCGEAFSRGQAWVEGALESAARVVDRITAAGA